MELNDFFMKKMKKEEEMEFFLYFICDFVLDFFSILIFFFSPYFLC